MKEGIYEVKCKECSKLTYIEQTRRVIETRYKEQCAHIKNKHLGKSAIADHALIMNTLA